MWISRQIYQFLFPAIWFSVSACSIWMSGRNIFWKYNYISPNKSCKIGTISFYLASMWHKQNRIYIYISFHGSMIYYFLHILTCQICLVYITQHSICCSIFHDRTYFPNSMNNLFLLVFCINSTQIDIYLLWFMLSDGRDRIRNLLTYPLSVSWFSVCFYIPNHCTS